MPHVAGFIPGNPAVAGEVLVLYFTGLADELTPPVRGWVAASRRFSGLAVLPGWGLRPINFRVPGAAARLGRSRAAHSGQRAMKSLSKCDYANCSPC